MIRLGAALALLVASAAAQATGGMQCRTAGPAPIHVSLGFGHVPGAALLQDSLRLTDNGRPVAVHAPQWWFDERELRLVLTDPQAQRREVVIKARRHGRTYDGTLWRLGKSRWVRCREG
jgi:hypothetical protein